MSVRHFIDLDAIEASTLRRIVDDAHAMKAAGKRVPAALKPAGIEDAVLVMVFERPSTRTRVSFDVAMRQLGGQTIVLNADDIQLGRGESIADTARVLSRYGDAIMLRTTTHASLLELAANSSVPVINALSDLSHPCQLIADVMTFEEHKGPIAGRTVAWIGDGNNVALSFIHAAVRFGFRLKLGCPVQFYPDAKALAWAEREGGDVMVTTDPAEAVSGAACVVADTWVSMGQSDAAARKAILEPYRVDETLMAKASHGAIFMHCLPAYRGNEVSAAVIDGPQSVVFDEAENRLHAQKAILAWCLGKGARKGAAEVVKRRD